MRYNIKTAAAILLTSVLVTSCDTTRIVSTYEKPDRNETTYDEIFVVGISGESIPKEQMEMYLVEELKEEGFSAGNDQDIFSPNMDYNDANKNIVNDKLNDRGYDAVLTFSLIDLEKEADFNVGTYGPGYYPVNYRFYNDYWTYYGYYAPQAYAMGYYTPDRVYQMEANLYDVNSGELIWGARSETTDPQNSEIFAEDFADTVSDELSDLGIITSTEDQVMK